MIEKLSYTRRGKILYRNKSNYQDKECLICGKVFKPTSGVQKFCEQHSINLMQKAINQFKAENNYLQQEEERVNKE